LIQDPICAVLDASIDFSGAFLIFWDPKMAMVSVTKPGDDYEET